MDTPQIPPASGAPALRRHEPITIGILVAGVLMLLLSAALIFPQLTYPIRTSISAQRAANTLSGAIFFSDKPTATAIYTAEKGSYKEQSSDGVIISTTRTKDGDVRIIQTKDGFEIRAGERLLVQSKAPLLSLDHSPDGKYVTYAEQTSSIPTITFAAASLPFFTLTPNDWSVVVLDIAANTRFVMGAGVHPSFVDATHIVRITPVGIFSTNILTGESTELLKKSFTSVSTTGLVSPSHEFIGVSVPTEKRATIYRASATTLEEVASLSLGERFSSYTLGNTGLYVLRAGQQGTEVRLKTFMGEDIHVVTLPESMQITRIIVNQ